MQNYVVGFAFNKDLSRVLLIRKNKPEWQKGLLNGIGGKIEKDETTIVAMIREFEEECSIKTSYLDWCEVCTLNFSFANIIFFATVLSNNNFESYKSTTDEIVQDIPVWEIPLRNDVIYNLKFLIPLALDRLRHE